MTCESHQRSAGRKNRSKEHKSERDPLAQRMARLYLGKSAPSPTCRDHAALAGSVTQVWCSQQKEGDNERRKDKVSDWSVHRHGCHSILLPYMATHVTIALVWIVLWIR